MIKSVSLFKLMPVAALWVLLAAPVTAQSVSEPEIEGVDQPRTLLDEDLRYGLGMKLQINNFGFGLGGQYRHVLGPYTQGIFEVQITPNKDVSEQSFQFFGQQIIPNKYNRILALPMLVGAKHRVFPQTLSDEFRPYIQAMGGPSLAFVYPYFNELEGEDGEPLGYLAQGQMPYDIFQGWGDGSFTWGTSGHVSLGVDFGSNFARLSSVQLGYYFFYYPDAIQVMEPETPPWIDGPGDDPRHFFGTPQVSLVFGSMW